jgi:hypothetical protein
MPPCRRLIACASASSQNPLKWRVTSTCDEMPVTVTWRGIPPQVDVTRHFSGFWELAEAQAMSRLHGGIHYDFDNRAGQECGIKVAEYVADRFLLPRRGDRD